MLHIHVFLVAPLCYLPHNEGEPRATSKPNFRLGNILPIGFASRFPGSVVQSRGWFGSFSSVQTGMWYSQGFFDAILHLFCGFFQFYLPQSSSHILCLCHSGGFAFLGICLEHFGYQLPLRTRHNREYVAVKLDNTALVFGVGYTSPTSSKIPRHLSPIW